MLFCSPGTMLGLGGPDVSSRQYFFRTKKIEGPKFHVTPTSDSRKIKSLITSPPPTWRCTLPRTLARFYSPLRAGISRFRNVVACRLPRGVPLRCRNFLFLTPGCTTPCKPHTKDDIFLLWSTESPSHALNLVGRWLLPGETCSRHPSSTRPRVGLLLLAAPADRARANNTGVFSAKNILTRRFLRTPPYCNSITPPSPTAPLNYIERVSSRSREDIEGGGLGGSR
jgi:hypothetical protein